MRYWSEIWFDNLNKESNVLGYYVDCHRFDLCYFWTIDFYKNQDTEEELKNIFIRIDPEKGMCYTITGPFIINSEPKEIQFEIEIPFEIKPEYIIPNINSVDDYMNIVAPHCEALLEFLLKIHNNKITQ
jgi:hypothetical protein